MPSGLMIDKARSLATINLFETRSDLHQASCHGNPGRFKGGDLFPRCSLAAGDDRPGMPHPFARRGGDPGDKRDDRLFDMSPNELSRLFLGTAADLADHYDRLGPLVLVEQFQA